MYSEIITTIIITISICFIIWLVYELKTDNHVRSFFKDFDKYIADENKLSVRYSLEKMTKSEFNRIKYILEEERNYQVFGYKNYFIISHSHVFPAKS